MPFPRSVSFINCLSFICAVTLTSTIAKFYFVFWSVQNLTIPTTQVSLLMKGRFTWAQHGGQKVLTFEPQDTIGIWFYIHSCQILIVFMNKKIFVRLVLFARPNSQHKSPSPSSGKELALVHTRDLGPSF